VTGSADAGPNASLLAQTRRRLALSTMAVVGALVLALGAATAVVGTSILDQEVDRALASASAAYLGQLGGETGQEDHEASESHEPQASDTFFLVLDASGALVANPSGVPLAGLPDLAAVAAARAAGSDLRTVDAGGTRIRLRTARIGEDGTTAGWLQTGIVLTLHDRQSGGLVLAVLLVGALGLAGAALATLWITGRALVPIRAAFETERRFVADASHEIRTPAAVIRSSAEILQREELVAPAGRPLVDDIVGEADRLGRLVEDLLALAASERGTLAIETGPVDLAALTRTAVRRATPLAQDRGLRLGGPDATVPPIAADGDADRLLQVLLILLDNAFRHSPAGATVSVTVARAAGGRGRVEVQDQGPGVPPAMREKIFEPFARMPASRSRADAGSGLGLAIARRLVELHEGTLTVDEAPGGGARFVLELPTR
jgi:two-component system sensor histidine kinase CiaH